MFARLAPALLFLLALGACTEDAGRGRVVGALLVPDCEEDQPLNATCAVGDSPLTCEAFAIDVDFFALERDENVAFIRLQSGGRSFAQTDGLLLQIDDIRALRGQIGVPVPIAPEANIRAALGLFDRCPDTTQNFELRGSVVFSRFGARKGDRVTGAIERLEVRDGRGETPGEVLGVLRAEFDFTVRGGPPYQPFPRVKIGDVIEVLVERPAFGGDLIARAPDGRVLFVQPGPGGLGAPGDRVAVRLSRVRKRHLRGALVRRVDAGAGRAEPFCEHADRCGGCPWQAVPLSAQRAALADHVERLARGIDPDVEVAPLWTGADRAWRSTARLHWRDGRLGYFAAGGRAVVEIDRCPVLAEPLNGLLAAARGALEWTGEGTLRLTGAPGSASGTVALRPRAGSPTRAEVEALVAKSPAIHGAAHGDARWGAPDRLGPAGVPHPPGAFVQAHQQGNAALVDEVKAALAGYEKVVELYAGAGNFTFALAAAGHRVWAVERAAAADALAEEARRRDLGERVGVQREDAGRVPIPSADAAVLDPPRAGAAEAVRRLHAAGLRRLAYVSCHPATWARDARWLVEQGWRLERVRAFDVFPHTGHVELVATLTGPTRAH